VSEKSKLSRREFLRVSAISALGVAAAACAKTTAPEEEPTKAPEKAEPTPTQPPVEEAKEAPSLGDLVSAGSLPALDERVPPSPLLVEPVEEIGQYGGTWRRITNGDGMGYFRMANYVEPVLKWKRDVTGHIPNLVESWAWNDDGTELTANFHKGIKWSDGDPLTVDDYLFWWQDLVLNEEIPITEPAGTRTAGELMTLERLDDYTLKYTFSVPNPLFLEYHSRGYYHSSWFMTPSHYMKPMHPAYGENVADTDALLDHYNNRHQYPDMPTYTAWRVTQFSSGQRAIFERNPYYWKVDPEGSQLPYIDTVDTEIVQEQEIFTMKAIAGELDCQFRDFPIKDVPLLLENAEDGDYRIIMWTRGDYAWPWLILFYDYPDEGIVDLMYTQEFRQALSWAINRNRINEIVSIGLATPRQSALSADSAEFQTPEGKEVYERWANLCAAYEPDTAKALLDKIEVVDVDGDGFRERPDGTALELIVDVPITDTQSIDAMDLIKEDWEAVGLKTTINAIDGTVIGQRSTNGEIMIRAWGSACAWGLVSAPPVWTPIEGVSYCIGGQRIGLYYQTGGEQGVAPRPGSMLEKLQDAYTELITIVDPEERTRELLKAYEIHIDDGPIHIGTVGEHPSPCVVKNDFRNVSDLGIPGPWDLGYPGTASPEQFYIRQ
jgi:peptide/nickel transport system substrate-binding protein